MIDRRRAGVRRAGRRRTLDPASTSHSPPPLLKWKMGPRGALGRRIVEVRAGGVLPDAETFTLRLSNNPEVRSGSDGVRGIEPAISGCRDSGRTPRSGYRR